MSALKSETEQFFKTTALEHSEMVDALKKPGEDIIAELTPEKAHLIHMGIGVSGEAGELLDAIKKYTIYNKPLDKDNIIEELGDLEFFMEAIRKIFNLTRDQTLQANIDKLAKRYADKKFSNSAAQQRADKIEEYIECDMCDGCGWYEGGPHLQTTCETCKGTGKVKKN